MTQQYITLNQSNVRNLPINASRAPQVGDVLSFTGKVKVVEFDNRRTELLVFVDKLSGDEVTMSASALMRAHGTIRHFFKNFNYIGDVMEIAISTKVFFCVMDIETRVVETPNGIIRTKTMTIDCEN